MKKKLLILVNPKSGTGKSMEALRFIKANLDANRYDLDEVLSQHPNFFTTYLPTKTLSDYDTMVVIGGDGTMHEVVNGVNLRADIPPILLFPCGSGNAFNHDIDCLDWPTALQNLERCQTKTIDLFRLDFENQPSLLAFNITGWGLVSDINQTAERIRWLGTARYTIASLIQIFKNPIYKAKLTVDGEVLEADFSFVLACNTQHTGKAMKMAPLASLDDGLLDLLIVKHLPFYKLLQLFPQIFSGKHIHSPLLRYQKVKQFSIQGHSQTLNIDGEMKCKAPFLITVLPGQLTMIV